MVLLMGIIAGLAAGLSFIWMFEPMGFSLLIVFALAFSIGLMWQVKLIGWKE